MKTSVGPLNLTMNIKLRSIATESLGKICDPRAVEPLIEVFTNDYPRVRAKAAWSLDEMGYTTDYW